MYYIRASSKLTVELHVESILFENEYPFKVSKQDSLLSETSQ